MFYAIIISIYTSILLTYLECGRMYVCYLQFQDDAVLIPRETAWFGYYPDGAFDPALPPQKVEFFHARDLDLHVCSAYNGKLCVCADETV